MINQNSNHKKQYYKAYKTFFLYAFFIIVLQKINTFIMNNPIKVLNEFCLKNNIQLTIKDVYYYRKNTDNGRYFKVYEYRLEFKQNGKEIIINVEKRDINIKTTVAGIIATELIGTNLFE